MKRPTRPGVHPSEVTLYIPAHQASRTLPAAIASVQNLRPAPARFVIVADARSTDDTLDVARRGGAELIVQQHGRLGLARNMAIEHCRTTWLASCDADVVLEPDWLGALCAAADDETAAVGGGTLEMPHTPADRWRAVNMPHNWGPLSFDNPFMLVSEMMARAESLRAVGGYLPDLRYGEDSDLCQRLRQAGLRLRYQPSAVAHHDRGDSVRSVLDLRWNYAYHRQRARFESLPGLTGKLAVNQAYALQSLSRTLHSEAPDTCAIAALIWFHHALRDTRAALERWPLIGHAARDTALARVWAAMLDGSDARWREWLSDAAILLERTLPMPPNAVTESARLSGGIADLPGYDAHCLALTEATRAFTRSIPDAAITLLERSCEILRGRDGPCAWPTNVTESLAEATDKDVELAPIPTAPAWRWSDLEAVLRQLGAGGAAEEVRVSGPALRDEAPPEGKGERHAAWTGNVALVPHLECVARPEAVVAEALRMARLVVLGYRTPERVQLSRPVWTARDLAVVTAASGGRIVDFHTEAGFTRLIVAQGDNEREAPAPVGRDYSWPEKREAIRSRALSDSAEAAR